MAAAAVAVGVRVVVAEAAVAAKCSQAQYRPGLLLSRPGPGADASHARRSFDRYLTSNRPVFDLDQPRTSSGLRGGGVGTASESPDVLPGRSPAPPRRGLAGDSAGSRRCAGGRRLSVRLPAALSILKGDIGDLDGESDRRLGKAVPAARSCAARLCRTGSESPIRVACVARAGSETARPRHRLRGGGAGAETGTGGTGAGDASDERQGRQGQGSTRAHARAHARRTCTRAHCTHTRTRCMHARTHARARARKRARTE